MVDPDTPKNDSDITESRLETFVGIAVVVLATFLGLSSVKAGNIGQKMQQAQVDRNDHWAWYQARNIRQAVYEATANEFSIPFPGESEDIRRCREAKAADYREKATSQERKMELQMADAKMAEATYETLGAKDDQFDLCEAALAIGLAMMGVTALLKQWWMFYLSLVPSCFGLFMGFAGFAGIDTSFRLIRSLIDLLS
jgi:hypothetical protein